MTEINWEEPPDHRTSSTKHTAFADALRKRPGKWAYFVHENSRYAMVTEIKAGRLAAYRPVGAFEATARTQPDGTQKIYVRYVGDPG
jgi:hypothetical protein